MEKGLDQIGYHCWSTNVPSAATAEKVGFRLALEHPGLEIWFNRYESCLMNGNDALLRDDFAAASNWYQRALGLVEDGHPDVTSSRTGSGTEAQIRYFLRAACAAALSGDRESALRALARSWETGYYRPTEY